MSITKPTSLNVTKEYVLKVNGECFAKINCDGTDQYHQEKSSLLDWKYMNLMDSSKGKKLNKLWMKSHLEVPLTISILVNCYVNESAERPLVYYSPTKEAIMIFDGDKYHLYGGISSSGKAKKYHTASVDIAEWEANAPVQFQPLKNNADGWAMEYQLNVTKNDFTYLYDWEISSPTIHDIEGLHVHYENVLAASK
ncbi:hypothetical protein LGQ02_07270 [Bacillus shivajii]|uniref:hypothetical protein n=1 Tax=Bacillus shivajii TaxID=1983719 RepID=UPI001CFB22AD|nr:hypothetical protein [Bacillus shivajii]UCZ54549.1 hypothetical protein LGQ02_07270 [Bacillus shivajii]